MKKRILSILLVSAVLFSSCGNKNIPAEQKNTDTDIKTVTSAEEIKSETAATGSYAGKYNIIRFGAGETLVDGDLLVSSGMDKSYMLLNDDHTGLFVFNDAEIPVEWTDKGEILSSGVVLYTFSVENDVFNLDMMGTPIVFLREGADVPADLVSTATYVNGEDYNNTTADTAIGKSGSRNYRHLMANEKVLEVDGGVLYYELFSWGAEITYGNVESKNLYIPAEIEGKTVQTVRRLTGNIENLYLPCSVEYVRGDFGNFEGIKSLTIGYDGDESKMSAFTQGCCDYSHFKRDNLERVVFAESFATNEEFIPGASAFGESYNLKEVVNMPPVWKEGVESLEKGVAMLKNPNDYIDPQSAKVKAVADEITKGLTTDSEKVYAICKWVVNTVVYDKVGYNRYMEARSNKYSGYEYNEADYEFASNVTDPEGVIDKKVAVCEGFSRLTKALCNAEGIPAVVVSGVIPSEKELPDYHAWNMVYFDGEWKHIDTTFCNRDFNAYFRYDEDGRPEEILAQDVTITYEQYLANEELQQDYTWEDIQTINQINEEEQGFDHRKYYYCLPALAMGADHIATDIDGKAIK